MLHILQRIYPTYIREGKDFLFRKADIRPEKSLTDYDFSYIPYTYTVYVDEIDDLSFVHVVIVVDYQYHEKMNV